MLYEVLTKTIQEKAIEQLERISEHLSSIGEKEDYGSTIIVEQTNGIDVFYGNININNINMYDYVKKGSLIGEVKTDKFYLVFFKDGKYLNYKDYI